MADHTTTNGSTGAAAAAVAACANPNHKLAQLLRECAGYVERNEFHPDMYQALGQLHAYAGSHSSHPDNQQVTQKTTTVSLDHSNASATHVMSALANKFQKGLGGLVQPVTIKPVGGQQQATSLKNAERARSELEEMAQKAERGPRHKTDSDWCDEHFCLGCRCKEHLGMSEDSAEKKVNITTTTATVSTTAPRPAKPAFQRPVNPNSILIANGWIEQHRRSKMAYKWKDVLASLVEGRKVGEETTLWIQREMTNPLSSKTELEALHQIPIKWIMGVEYFEHSTDHRFALKVYNIAEEFLFRCATEEAAQNWVLTLRSVREVVMKNSKKSTNSVEEWGTTTKEEQAPSSSPREPSVERVSPPMTVHRMKVLELRAIAHGAGINTAGMERQELEAAVAKIANGAQPDGKKRDDYDDQKRREEIADAQRRARLVEEEARKREEEERKIRVEEEERQRQLAEEDHRRRLAAEEEVRRRLVALEHQRAEDEARKRQDELRRQQMEEQRQEEIRRRQTEEQRQEEIRRRQAEEEARKRQEELRRRQIEEQRQEEIRRRQAEEEQRRRAAEEEISRRKLNSEKIRRAAEQQAAEQRRRQEEAQSQKWQQQQQRHQPWQYPQQQQRPPSQQPPGWQQQQPQRGPQAQWQQQQQPPNSGKQPFYGGAAAAAAAAGGRAASPPGQVPPPPQHGAGPQPSSPVNMKYAKMAAQDDDDGVKAAISKIKHLILLQWALQPPRLQMLRPIDDLLSTIHNVFPPAFGVAGHDYFIKWTAIKRSDLIPVGQGRPDEEKLKKCVKRLRFFLHPDKLPRDLNEEQLFMCKMLWDVTNDAWEEFEKHKEELDWIRS